MAKIRRVNRERLADSMMLGIIVSALLCVLAVGASIATIVFFRDWEGACICCYGALLFGVLLYALNDAYPRVSDGRREKVTLEDWEATEEGRIQKERFESLARKQRGGKI